MISVRPRRQGGAGGVGAFSRMLLAGSVIFVVFSGTLIGWISFERAARTLETEMHARLQAIARQVALVVATTSRAGDGARADLPRLLEEMRTVNRLENLFIFDRGLRSIADARPSIVPGKLYSMLQLEPERLEDMWRGQAVVSGRRNLEGTRFLSAYAAVDLPEGRAGIYAETGTAFLDPVKEHRQTIGILVAAILAVALTHLFLLWELLRNLERAHTRAAQWERLGFAAKVGAEVAHEIKNPLGIIRATANAMQRHYDPSGKDERFTYIDEEVERLSTIASRLTSISRDEPLVLSETDLAGLAGEVLEEFRRDPSFAGIELVAEVEPGLPPLQLDRRQMKQVLINLVLNARQAQDAAGWIRVGLGRCGILKRRILLCVEDRGRGMDRTEMQRMFEPFHTTKVAGSGLGLPIVLRIVEAHGGTLSMTSARGRGTRVEILLPAPGGAA